MKKKTQDKIVKVVRKTLKKMIKSGELQMAVSTGCSTVRRAAYSHNDGGDAQKDEGG